MKVNFNLNFDEQDGVKTTYVLTNGTEVYDSEPSYKVLISNFADNCYQLPGNLAIYKLTVKGDIVSLERVDGKDMPDLTIELED